MAANQDRFEKAMKAGHSAAWDRIWDKAAEYYRQALAETPDSPAALTSLGLALIELAQLDEALACYRRAAVLTPEDPLPVEKVAQICERQGRTADATRAALQAADLYIKNREVDKAIENWLSVTRFNPEHINAHTRLAMTFERLGRKAESVREYLAVAAIMQHSGDASKAAQAVSYALQLQPDSSEARQALSIIKLNQALPMPAKPKASAGNLLNRPATSPEDRDKAFPRIDPISEATRNALTVLAGILFTGGDELSETPAQPRRGLDSIARGASSGESEQTAHTRMVLYLTQTVNAQSAGQFDQAETELAHAVESGLNHPAAHFDLGYLQCRQKKWDEALNHLRIAVKHPDYALATRLLMGEALQALERLNEAAIEHLEALKIADGLTVPGYQADDVRALYEPLIDAQSRERNPQVLRASCDNIRAQLLRPDWREHLDAARAQLQAQSGGQGVAALAELLLQTSGGDVVEAIARVRSLAGQGLWRTAVEEAHFALEEAPTFFPLHIQIGELLFQQGFIQEAIDKFNIVARAYSIRGEASQATNLMRRIVQVNPRDMDARKQLVEHLRSQGQIDEALKESMELAEVYFRTLADLESARRTYNEALRLAQQSSASRSWTLRILHAIADIDMQRLDYRQALRIYEQIRALQPDNEKVRSTLVELNFKIGQDGAACIELDSYLNYLESTKAREKALPFLRALVAERPEKFELRKRLADSCRQAGLMEETIAQLDEMGDILMTSGNRQGAIAIIQTIINFNPPNVAEYQSLLARLRASKN
jgi:tetratricopeptide (TPR) repeat protein